MTEHEVVSQFIEFMRQHGVEPADTRDIAPSDRLSRFDVAGKPKGNKNGWFKLYIDEMPAGVFGDWSQGHLDQGIKWKLDRNPGREFSEEEKRAYVERRRARERERDQAIAEAHAEAAKRSAEIWAASSPAPDDHPYLERKGIRAHIARISPQGDLVIPVTKQGALVGLQFIKDDGTKLFKFGTDIIAAHATIGRPVDQVIICEGFSTAATIHEATDIPVVIAFNAGNLEPVARAVRAKVPDARIIIAVDDDRFPNPKRVAEGKPHVNAGMIQGLRAAAAVKAELRRPIFKSDAPGKPTDFNDVAELYGVAEVREQITNERATWSAEPVALTEIPKVNPFILREPYPHTTDKGVPLSTIENLDELLARVGVVVRYNVIAKDEEILIPGARYSIDNAKNAALAQIISWCKLAKVPTENVDGFLTSIADANPYNPVATWIASKPWDGITRLPEFYATVTAKDEDTDPTMRWLKETLLRRWMISAVAAAHRPSGVSAHGVLVFQGAQYLGKTAWFKRLAPPELEVLADGQILDPSDRDSVKRVVTKWLVELGELDATFKKSDIAQLKAFITRDRDEFRNAYAKKESTYARRTVFFASVNEDQFLADRTGNRRYWTIPVVDLDHRHSVDMQQVWAEIYALYEAGEGWYLTPDEMSAVNAQNKAHELVDPWVEKLQTAYLWHSPAIEWRALTASQIAAELGINHPNERDLKGIGRGIREITTRDARKSDGRRVFDVPPMRGARF